jgi:CDP-diacylglycerol--glycerol-3-phosphate 3-phosphatidyltransferase
LFATDSRWGFLALVGLIGISDVADGFIARKFGWESKMGARLDSVGDLVFFWVVMVVVFLNYRWIITENLVLLAIIVLIRVSSIVVSKIKFGEIAFIHTLGNKITGLLLFLFIMFLPFVEELFWVKGVLVIGILSASEELGIILRNKEINPNQKSIFKK